MNLATKMKANGVRPEIELFDLSHIHGARRLIEAGLMDERPHVQVVMGIKNALPAEEHLLDLMLGEIMRQLPDTTWTAAGMGQTRPVSSVGCWPAEGMGPGRGWRTTSVSTGAAWPAATRSWCGMRPKPSLDTAVNPLRSRRHGVRSVYWPYKIGSQNSLR